MVPAVLLGGLNVLRAFGLAGIPVVLASSERRTPAMASRYCAGVIELPPIVRRGAVVEALAREGARLAAAYGERPPLYCDNEDRLKLVQDFRDVLAPHFALLLNEPCLDAALLDKARFQSLAERLGLPVPRRLDWDALGAETRQVLVKPKTKSASWREESLQRQLFGPVGKARIFPDGAAARADPLVRRLAGELAFQEYIPGGDDAIWSFHGFALPGGDVRTWFVGRKIRTHPPLTGDSSYLRLARDERLVALGRRVARELPLAGVFKMDFKRDPASGRFHLLEVNTRCNLWNYLGAVNGVNLASASYHYLVHGMAPVHREARLRYRWLNLRFDWKARGPSAARWLASLLYAPKIYDLFAWSDPMPFARYWTERLRAALARRMSRWLATAS